MDATQVTHVLLEAMEENRCEIDNLVRLGVPRSKAWEFANTRKGYWHIANSHILATSLTNEYFRKLGLAGLSEVYSSSLSLRTAVCRTARTVV